MCCSCAWDEFSRDPNAIDVVVLELKMPGLGGFQTYREIRQLRGDVPIIFSSGYREVNTRQRVEIIGPADFIRKP